MGKRNTPTKKEMEKYREFLEEAGKLFVLTPNDLSNLFDCFYITNWRDYEDLRLNKMGKWFKDFFNRLDEIVISDKENYKKILKKLKNKNGNNRINNSIK